MAKSIQHIQQYIINNSVKGWLTLREGALLYRLAGKCPARLAIVEIGSWQGKSAIYLSNGSQFGDKAHIFAVDPHTGPEQAVKDIWTYDIFMKNVTGGGIMGLVTPIVKFSEEASKDFNKPVGLIFIDGDHSYEAVKIDFEKWHPKVVDGGVIAFHDSIKYEGPRKLLAEIIPGSLNFKNAGVVDSIFFVTKTVRNNTWDRLRNRYILFLRKLIEYGAHLNHKKYFPKWFKAAYKKWVSYIQGRAI